MEPSQDFLDEYYQDFTRENTLASTGAAFIWVVSFNRWLPGCEFPRKAILKGLITSGNYEFKREIDMLKYASKIRAVVKYYHHIQNSINKWIFMEYCEKGSLSNYIIKQKEKGSHFAYHYIAWQYYWIAEALHTLHSSERYHRDIKPDNIFVSDVETFILGDFGASRDKSYSSRSSETVIGTELYMSPSLLGNYGLGKSDTRSLNLQKDDVWALGKTIYETTILETGIDFRWKQESEVMKVINENLENLGDKGYQPKLKNLIRWMMVFDEDNRPTMEDVAYELKDIIESMWNNSFQTLTHDAITLERTSISYLPRKDKAGSAETTSLKLNDISILSDIRHGGGVSDFDSFVSIIEESKSEIQEKCIYCNKIISEDGYFELECKHKYHKWCIKVFVESRVKNENTTQHLSCVACPIKLDLKRIIHGDLGLSEECVERIFKLFWREEKFICPKCNTISKNSILSSDLKPHFINCNNCSAHFCSFCKESRHKKCYEYDAYLKTYLSIFRRSNKAFNLEDIV